MRDAPPALVAHILETALRSPRPGHHRVGNLRRRAPQAALLAVRAGWMAGVME